MTPDTQDGRTELGPWNPGIVSRLPAAYRPLSSLFRPENAFTPAAEAQELADFTGLEIADCVAFRPERLALHELLIRVSAELSVPDGPRYEDLGINFRTMTERLFNTCVRDRMDEVAAAFDALKREAGAALDEALAALAPPPEMRTERLPWWRRLGSGPMPSPSPAPPGDDPAGAAVERWRARAAAEQDDLRRAALEALVHTADAVMRRHGRLVGDRALLRRIALDRVANTLGSERIGALIEPWVLAGAAAEGFRVLPAQTHPVVMNVKGASASGKSSMRPLQRRLAARRGIDWADFALISPDIWRKYLLDYDSLGDAFRYAGTLSGVELEIVDQKLDRHMARKAERGRMTHLLIDRFRFDSFTLAPDGDGPGRLLTRFGHVIYMFFMITPPEATVERAWTRGLQFGRYKAVDDLLDHNVEAYEGMPGLFFTWAQRADKRVHVEFLDNGVAEGETPRTVAWGWNDTLTVLDIGKMLDVDRYRRIDIDAKSPAQVYPSPAAMAPERNTGFLRACAERIPRVDFAEFDTGRIYARLESGRLVWTDPAPLARALADADARAGLTALAPDIADAPGAHPAAPEYANRAGADTLGRWGA
jgi:hypothetical protein